MGEIMPKRILILGASGTVGKKLVKYFSGDDAFTVTGTFCSNKTVGTRNQMIQFSVEQPQDICAILENVRPDVVVSALRGDFEKQLVAHKLTAKHLANSNVRFIYLSTLNVFDGDRSRPHYESDARISSSDYGNFKIQCEDLLLSILKEKVAVLRVPFVWGKDSPRLQEVIKGCQIGRMNVYEDFFSNHVSDLQIAQFIQWVVTEKKCGVFHVGSADVIRYRSFIEQLIGELNLRQPEFISQIVPGTMAVLSERNDIPSSLKWSNRQIVQYLGER